MVDEKYVCYVYGIYVDGIVRYIGKGTGQRYKIHLQYAKAYLKKKQKGEILRLSKFYVNLINAIEQNSILDCKVMISNLSSEEAFAKEKELIENNIKFIWNVLPGGEGFDISKVIDKENFYRNLKIGIKKSWENPGRHNRHSEICKDRWRDEAARKSHQIILLKSWSKEGLKEMHSNRMKKIKSSKDGIKSQKNAANARWRIAGEREKQGRIARAMQLERSAKKNANISNSFLAFGA